MTWCQSVAIARRLVGTACHALKPMSTDSGVPGSLDPLGRFQVSTVCALRLGFEDRLRTGIRHLGCLAFDGLAVELRHTELLRLGFLDAALPPALREVADRPLNKEDGLFWQFPCRTEAAAHELHQALPEAPRHGDEVHVYLGLPWATFIDKRSRLGHEPADMQRELMMQRVRLSGYRQVLQAHGAGLRVHTVCQHILWPQLLDTWKALGVTDAWLSHAPPGCRHADAAPLTLHPWRLFAVNVEDPQRRTGLRVGVDPADKPLLASFVGAHADDYVSDVRPRLMALAGEPGLHVRMTEQWHFGDVVYQHQVLGHPLHRSYRIDDAVASYNTVLSDSVFSLCPSGSGPNTLRLWESLAVGAVPVLLGVAPELPCGGTLPPIDWDAIVVRVADEQIPQLPALLRQMPLAEVRRRQALGLQAFEQVRQQRCF